MKNFKISVATAALALALASGSAAAAVTSTGNTATDATANANYHLSTVIGIIKTQDLQFQDLVLPTTGATTYTTVDNTGAISYGSGGSPSGSGSTSVNTGANSYAAQTAKFTVTGETNYQFSVSAEHTNPATVTLDLYKLTTTVSPANATNNAAATTMPSSVSTTITSPLGNENLGSSGSKGIEFGGQLTAYDNATAGSSGISISVTVAYN